MHFYCPEKDCSFKGPGSYEVCLPTEAFVDEHNLADLFCPHCRKPLVKSEEADRVCCE